jgi:hypothetical protein
LSYGLICAWLPAQGKTGDTLRNKVQQLMFDAIGETPKGECLLFACAASSLVGSTGF